MATLQHPHSDSDIRLETVDIIKAIEHGDIVRLMAAVDAGTLDRQQFERALEQYSKTNWFRELLNILFNRR